MTLPDGACEPAGAVVCQASCAGSRAGRLECGGGARRSGQAGKRFAKVESGKWLGKINAPVDGELAEVNEDLEDNPGLINEDCYGRGWMYKIRPNDKADLAKLIHGAEAVRAWVAADIAKFASK